MNPPLTDKQFQEGVTAERKLKTTINNMPAPRIKKTVGAKKKPLTKAESNKQYLIRKKAKAEAAMFVSVLETPYVDVPPVEDEVVLPPPTNPFTDVEDYEPYAPSHDKVPLARGETQETAIKPGDWHSPKVEEAQASFALEELEDALDEPKNPSEATPKLSLDNLPYDSAERVRQAIDGIKWLSQRVKNLPPRTKAILHLRINRLEELIRAMQ